MSRPKVILSIAPGIADELERIALELREKKSSIVEKALILYFDQLDVKIADKRMRDVVDGKSELIPAEEVYKEL